MGIQHGYNIWTTHTPGTHCIHAIGSQCNKATSKGNSGGRNRLQVQSLDEPVGLKGCNQTPHTSEERNKSEEKCLNELEHNDRKNHQTR
jgi:hypothetical protein